MEDRDLLFLPRQCHDCSLPSISKLFEKIVFIQLRGLWAIDFRKDCSLQCVITRNWKQILTFSFFCCVDKHPKSITGCKNLRFNTRWLCYSVWGKTHVYHNSGFNSETILHISIFLFYIRAAGQRARSARRPAVQNVSVIAQGHGGGHASPIEAAGQWFY